MANNIDVTYKERSETLGQLCSLNLLSLYKRVCPSVCQCVGQSVHPSVSVCRSVRLLSRKLEQYGCNDKNFWPHRDAVDDQFQHTHDMLTGIEWKNRIRVLRSFRSVYLSTHVIFPINLNYIVLYQIFCLQGMQLTINSSTPWYVDWHDDRIVVFVSSRAFVWYVEPHIAYTISKKI